MSLLLVINITQKSEFKSNKIVFVDKSNVLAISAGVLTIAAICFIHIKANYQKQLKAAVAYRNFSTHFGIIQYQ